MFTEGILLAVGAELALFTFIIIFWTILLIIYQYIKRIKKEKKAIEDKNRLLELKIQSLELDSIKYKLNPHLFKNALNSIQSHAYQTYYSLDKLANVLDFILYESDRSTVSLKEEIDFSLSLIEINRLKLSPLFNLKVKNKINDAENSILNLGIAPLVTVDLIENAFKHVDIQHQDSFISIIYEFKKGMFILNVSNKIGAIQKIKKNNSGFGNENLEKRLMILYGNQFSIERFVEDDIYTAILKIKLSEQYPENNIVG